jgi:CheY-like chemotaxis protein
MSMNSGPTILIVEDEILIGQYLGDVLRDAGYEVIAAFNADKAIEILESRSDVRLIITDINMPGSMDGLRLAAAIRDKWPPIKIIIATGKERPTGDQMPDGSLFLSKPYDPKAVISAVQRLI